VEVDGRVEMRLVRKAVGVGSEVGAARDIWGRKGEEHAFLG